MNAPAHLSRIKGGEHLAAAYEAIRQYGIREARQYHMARLKQCRALHNHHMFEAFIYPAPTLDEAIEDAKEFLRAYGRMPTYRRPRHYVRMVETKERIAVLRYFRRYGAVIWMEAAA